MPAPASDLREWIALLERKGELVRVSAEVDPDLEITEITDRVVKSGGPALLFEKVRGSRMPLLIVLAASGSLSGPKNRSAITKITRISLPPMPNIDGSIAPPVAGGRGRYSNAVNVNVTCREASPLAVAKFAAAGDVSTILKLPPMIFSMSTSAVSTSSKLA